MRQTPFKWDRHTFSVEPFFEAGRLPMAPHYCTSLGALFSADCMRILPSVRDGIVDTVFADPPFNLGKEYGENTDELRPDSE